MTGRLPNFLVIGAAKSGTDALCASLAQHPDVFLSPNKEPMFFIAEGRPRIPYRGTGDREVMEEMDMWVSTVESYRALFAGATTETAVGEASTWYLYQPEAPPRIRRHVPDARLIAILRNPVDRAYSAFTMLLRDGRETRTDFSRALAAEDRRVASGWEPAWHYRRMGLYHAQLMRYRETFPASQIHVALYDDFSSDPLGVLRDLFRFLGVDDRFEPDTSVRANVSMVPTSPAYHRVVAGRGRLRTAIRSLLPTGLRRRIRRGLPASRLTRPAPLTPEMRRELAPAFRSDVLRLQALIGRDLSGWLA